MLRLTLLLALLATPSLLAQDSPFLPEDIYQKFVNEASGEIAHENMRFFTQHHRPMGGSPGFEAVARYVEKKAKDYGLEDVRYIALKSDTPSWYAKSGELWLTAPERRRLAFSPEVAIALSDYSRDTDIADAGLVDVGDGTTDGDYAGKEVRNQVVLASGSISTVMNEAVWKRGALGIIYFSKSKIDFPDQLPWTRIPVENAEKTKKGTFAFVLSTREGLRLRKSLEAQPKPDPKSRQPKAAPFRVSVKIDSEFIEPSSQAIVEAVIRGSEIHDQDIVLTGHLQEELFSANDDASGCVSVLEIARAMKRMIDDGRLPRPRRDIRFWWADEISAEEQYFSDFPDERAQFLANINQDMVGAKQSIGSRVQFVTRPPWSRAHFMGDVIESIVESLVQGNTAYLAAGQARQLTRGLPGTAALADEDIPFSRPILSRLGSRERYDARVIPFHNNTDHQVFNIGIIGIPAVTFTNWPDDYIHSTDDDLWQMDRTQLKRNIVAVGTAAWYLATIDDDDLPTLYSQVQSEGLARISADLATSLRMLDAAPVAERAAALKRSTNLVEQSVDKELRTVASIARVASNPQLAQRLATEASRYLLTRDAAAARVTNHFQSVGGAAATPAAADAREAAAAARIPLLTTSVKDYMAGRSKLEKPKNLHGLMAYETLNFVDGTRSYLDIFKAVSAQADSAGSWYYGRVALDDVVAYLDSAQKAGLLTLRK